MVLEATIDSIDKERVPRQVAVLSRDAGIGTCDDDRWKATARDESVEIADRGGSNERVLVPKAAMDPQEKRVLQCRIVTRRQVDVEIALSTQNGRKNTVVAAVVLCEIEDLAG